VNEASPVISSNGGGTSATINVAENGTAVTDVNATDADTKQTLAYSITGDDAGFFTIDANTGLLTFTNAPDFETPTDANKDGDYLVTVQVSDGNGGLDTQDLTIHVTDVQGENLVGDVNANKLVADIGNDTLSGAGGNDTLIGGANDDDLTGGADNDSLGGGIGTDTAHYDSAAAGIVVDLSLGTASKDGDGGHDTLSSIENVRGSSHDDNIAGNNLANLLEGLAGNDTLSGGGGAGILDGGAGNDTLVWNATAKTLDGGADTDTLLIGEDTNLTGTTVVANMEKIDLGTGDVGHVLTLSAQDVLDITDPASHTLTIDGDAADTLDAGTGWTKGADDGTHQTYTQDLGGGPGHMATLLVADAIIVNPDITS